MLAIEKYSIGKHYDTLSENKGKKQYKNQLKIPASVFIGLTGLYWFIESII